MSAPKLLVFVCSTALKLKGLIAGSFYYRPCFVPTHNRFIEWWVGCHPEALKGRRVQRPIRVLSMVQRPLRTYFEHLSMTPFFLSILRIDRILHPAMNDYIIVFPLWTMDHRLWTKQTTLLQENQPLR